MLEYVQLDAWGNTHDLCIEAGRYSYGGSLFMGLYEKTEDGELDPFSDLTVNLPDCGSDRNCAFVDTNNLPEAEKLITEYGLGKRTGRMGRSDFCTYPEYEFYPEALEKYCLNPEALMGPVIKNMERNDAR